MTVVQHGLFDAEPETPANATMPLERHQMAQDARNGESAPPLPTHREPERSSWEATMVEYLGGRW